MSFLDVVSSVDPALAALVASAMSLIVATLALTASARRTKADHARDLRVHRMELRMTSFRDEDAVGLALHTIRTVLPGLNEDRVNHVLSRCASDLTPGEAREIAEALVDSLRTNSLAAIDIANAILENDNLLDEGERRRVAREIKSHALKLDASFWVRHGHIIRQSGFPARLKMLLQRFFEQVSVLKRATSDLPRSPSRSNIDDILDHAVALIETSVNILDELEKQAGRRKEESAA